MCVFLMVPCSSCTVIATSAGAENLQEPWNMLHVPHRVLLDEYDGMPLEVFSMAVLSCMRSHRFWALGE